MVELSELGLENLMDDILKIGLKIKIENEFTLKEIFSDLRRIRNNQNR